MIPITVVLEVEWNWRGYSDNSRPPGEGFFHINPENFTGKRLYRLLGTRNFVVTNACREVVTSARGRGTPNPEWLRANLATLRPRLVVLCGRVAQQTFQPDMAPGALTHSIMHPAARTWTNLALDTEAIRIQRLIRTLK